MKELEKIIQKENPQRIMLFHGKTSYEKSGAKELLEPLLKEYQVHHFSSISPNPKIKEIENGICAFNQFNPDLIIAVGGGSVLDVAKSVNVLSNNKHQPLAYLMKEYVLRRKGKPLIAIPTTAGTGAEATQFSVIYVNKVKQSLDSIFLLPTYAVLMPELTKSMNPYQTAVTGMDALTQAVESLWSINSNSESDFYAKKAITKILDNLETAVNSPTLKSREQMLRGAHLSGKAINLTHTTACHAISYPITSYYNIPHGHAVALTLRAVLKFNSEIDLTNARLNVNPEHIKTQIKKINFLFKTESVERTAEKIENLMKNIGLETKLTKLGIPESSGIVTILNNVNSERMTNNPRIVRAYDILKILEEIK